MRQEIYDDPFGINDWERGHKSRCFVHIANSLVWRAITGTEPPTVPPAAKEYTEAGLPWFEYYSDDAKALAGSKQLQAVKTVSVLGGEKGDVPLPENETVTPKKTVEIRSGMTRKQVREGKF